MSDYFKRLDSTAYIGLIVGTLVLSTFLYDYNEVGLSFDLLHIFMKLTVGFGIIYLVQLPKISIENRTYILMYLLFIHGFFSSIYVDSGYHQSFNQAMAVFIVLSQNKVIKYYHHTVIIGFLLGAVSLFYGAGFSYVAEYAGNPLSNYLHGTVIYCLVSSYAYYFIVQKNAKKLSEIDRMAKIGMKSSYLMHEIKNINLNKSSERFNDILDCINLIVGDKVRLEKVYINDIITLNLDCFKPRLQMAKIKVSLELKDFYSKLDKKSFNIIIKNILLNAIEHLELSEEDKAIYIKLNKNELIIENTCTHEVQITEILEFKKSTKLNPVNKGMGLNIIEELSHMNNIKVQFYNLDRKFSVKLTF